MKQFKSVLIWVILVLVFMVIYSSNNKGPAPTHKSYEVFKKDLAEERISKVQVEDNRITVQLFGIPQPYFTLGKLTNEQIEELHDQNVNLVFGQEKPSPLKEMLIGFAPLVLILGFFIWFMKRMKGGNNHMLSLTKSRAEKVKEKPAVTFDDVGGCDDAKRMLGEVVSFLKDPDSWTKAGARLPKGVLLEGPPGCGKTLLARAVAGMSDSNFYCISGAEFVELFVGVGAARVRDMFETARKNSPAVIFIDELDAVGRARGSGLGFANDEKETTLNQLLVCLDGFRKNDRIVVIGATNRADTLDKALIRAGRFDRVIKIDSLTEKEILEVIKIHSANKTIDTSVDLEKFAKDCSGLNGAQIEALMNEAALFSLRRSQKENGNSIAINEQDLKNAKELVCRKGGLLSGIDALLIESTNQLTQPIGKTFVKINMDGGIAITGEVLWANGVFIKLKNSDGGNEIAIAKNQIRRLESVSEGGQAV